MQNDRFLLERLRSIFRLEEWCKTLYEKSIQNQSSRDFSELLKTAASNYDDSKSFRTTTTLHVQPDSTRPNNMENTTLVASFFSKTPPPSNNRRPFRFRRYNRNNRAPRNRRFNGRYRSFQHRQMKPRCYLCHSEGHLSPDCPEKEKYRNRLTHLSNVGIAAQSIIDKLDINFSEDTDEIADYLVETGLIDEDDLEYPDFDDWICEILDIADESSQHQQPHYFKFSITELSQAMYELNTFAVFAVFQHLLLDTGAPKTLCAIDWLERANWKSVLDVALPPNFRPFRFAGNPIKALKLSCLVAEITSMDGKRHIFRQAVFVLPPTPIPFLIGLQIARKLAFNINLRENNGSHLNVTTWNTNFHLVVNSHIWIQFTPLNKDPETNVSWKPLINDALHSEDSNSNFCLPVSFRVENKSNKNFILPPWEREGWQSNMTPDNIQRLHENLRHPSPSSMIDLFRRQAADRRLPPKLLAKINERSAACKPCAEHASIPRTPKLAIPPPATPNIAVTLDVMHHTINGKHVHILVILDTGDKLLRLVHIEDDSAKTSFEQYVRRWISIFDAPIYTVVDRGTNLAATYMVNNLHRFNSQLISIPTEAPWSLGHNERSHRYIHSAIDKILCFDQTLTINMLLSEVEMAWNFSQHASREIPHLNRFGVMPRIIEEGNPTTLHQRISIMELVRSETDHIRTNNLLRRAFSPYHRYDRTLRIFSPNQKVWFHRKKHGWRQGIVAQVNNPSILVKFGNRIFPTHETRVRPYYEEYAIPPEIHSHDDESIDLPEFNVPEITPPTNTQNEIEESQSNIVSTISHNNFSVSSHQTTKSCLIEIEDHLTIEIDPSENGIIDSEHVRLLPCSSYIESETIDIPTFITSVQPVKNLKKLPQDDQNAFQKAKEEEIKFLIDKDVVKPIHISSISDAQEIQILKWVLQIKRNPTAALKIRHRARLVSASSISTLRHKVSGNAPTIGLSTIRIVISIVPTWDKQLRLKNDKMVVQVRDITKAYLQANPSQRLIAYEPPPEFFTLYPEMLNHVWLAIKQLYGDVEAGRHWHHTFIPWLCENIFKMKKTYVIYHFFTMRKYRLNSSMY
ncbi:MAG: hypothetical protein AAGG81_03645 [Chlamydiota bacterium]